METEKHLVYEKNLSDIEHVFKEAVKYLLLRKYRDIREFCNAIIAILSMDSSCEFIDDMMIYCIKEWDIITECAFFMLVDKERCRSVHAIAEYNLKWERSFIGPLRQHIESSPIATIKSILFSHEQDIQHAQDELNDDR